MAINASAVWRARPSGSNSNGGGYDSGISGAATDYSRQNAAQASGSHGTAAATSTFTDATAANFTAAMIGNCIQIVSGAGFTAGFYFVTAFTSASVVTLDRSPGTGTVAVWNLGGGWADFWTNTLSTGPLVPGNTVYILGAGIPNPSSYAADYAYTGTGFAPAVGNQTAGQVVFANDPSTPNYKAPWDTTGGMPLITSSNPTLVNGGGVNLYGAFTGLWIVASGGGGNFIFTNSSYITLIGCVFDQSGNNAGLITTGDSSVIGCEAFDSTNGAAQSTAAISLGDGVVIGCNVHDCTSHGIAVNGNARNAIDDCIVAKNKGDGIKVQANNSPILIKNCTIDGNLGHGVEVTSQNYLSGLVMMSNIISNHTQAGKYGVTVGAGTATQNSAIVQFFDKNTYYNNTTNYNAINAGAHDTALGSNPYNAQSTEDYTLI
jgi:Right handed beta helix region